VLIVMGKTDPTAETHRHQSMILVPRDVPGMSIERNLPIFGYQDQHLSLIHISEPTRLL